MLPTPPLRRALTAATHDTLSTSRRTPSVPVPVPAAQRQITSSSAVELRPENAQPVQDFNQILDIFDAPSRLGESSKLLGRSAAARSPSSRPTRPVNPAPRKSGTASIHSLPEPTIFDGPTRLRVRSDSAISATSSARFSLPDAVTFDGPSRVRAYSRGTSQQSSPRQGFPSLLVAGAVSAGGLLAWNQ